MNIFRKNSGFTTIMVLFLLLYSMYVVPEAFGNFKSMIRGKDSAFAAKFNIEITAPHGLGSSSSENKYQHYFPVKGDTKNFSFRIHNNSEVSVICRPYMNNGVSYRVIIEDEIQSQFFVETKEFVDFQVVVLSEGLSTDIIEASLFVDIQQPEGEIIR